MGGTALNELKKTPLHPLHLELKAKMAPFAGYHMPVHYSGGIKREHLHTRAQASLFDVSHMGQLMMGGESCREVLEGLVPSDIVGLGHYRQRYTVFTNEAGGILDDLMVIDLGESLFMVVNAACTDRDLRYLNGYEGPGFRVQPLPNLALLALQGPAAPQVLQRFAPNTDTLAFMSARRFRIASQDCIVSRCGYTGEDGFEISVPALAAERLGRMLLDNPEVEPAGLGARDSLRLEAGLCLYGQDLTEQTTPVEARLDWVIGRSRRPGGTRAGGFPGARVLFEQIAQGPDTVRVGLQPEGKAPVRHDVELVDEYGNRVGAVSSGGYSPYLDRPVAMGYVNSAQAAPGTPLWTRRRGQLLSVTVVELPFVAHRYRR
ncbi:MAG: glycine cleavage system aminomethyltransferase GcvT [Gammaproteobacteria bacterium]